MRYSYTALVLATVTISQVAAGPFRHAHEHYHNKKDVAEDLNIETPIEERNIVGVDWNAIAYTFSAGQTWGAQTAAPAPASTPTTLVTSAGSATAAASSTSTPKSGSKLASTGSTSNSLTATDSTLLLSSKMAFKALGVNAQSSSGASVWIGSDGPYTNEYTNTSPDPLILVVWGPAGSWVNAVQPLITLSLASGASTTLSFASGTSGAWSTLHADTAMLNGQVSNTWGEFTFSPEGVVDVSREPNMNGRAMEIVGPTCTSNMDTCVFVCTDPSQPVCMTGYALKNCTGQKGAQLGKDGLGADSGGCGGLGSAASLKTTLS